MKNLSLQFALFTFLVSHSSFAQNDTISANESANFCILTTTYDGFTNMYYNQKEEIQFVNDNLPEDTLSVLYSGDTIATLALFGDKVFIKRTSTPFNPLYFGFDPDFGNDFEVLYDYGLNVGDTALSYSSSSGTVIVQSVDFVDIQGVQKKRIFLNNGDVWIKGMGSKFHPLHPKMFVFEVVYNTCLAQLTYAGSSPIDAHTFVGDCDCATIGINDLDQSNQVEIYPNPTNQAAVKVISDLEILDITVNDMSGKAQNVFFDGNESLELTNLNNGVYFLSIFTESGVEYRKIIVRQ